MQNQIIGGNYQELNGAPLSFGYLEIRLSQEGITNTGIHVGTSHVHVPLDNSGNVSGFYQLWTNDQITPLPLGAPQTYYVFRIYSAGGQLVSGPYNLTITSSPSPFVLP